MAENGLLNDEKGLLATLMARENIQSTAVGNRVAIPHCLTDEIPDLCVIVARSIAALSSIPSTDSPPTSSSSS